MSSTNHITQTIRTPPGMLRWRGMGTQDCPCHPAPEIARLIAAGIEAGDTPAEIHHRLITDDTRMGLFAALYGKKGERRPRRPPLTLFLEVMNG